MSPDHDAAEQHRVARNLARRALLDLTRIAGAGHTGNCLRLAADVAAWDAGWDSLDAESEAGLE